MADENSSIIKILREKIALKQAVFQKTRSVFDGLRSSIQKLAVELEPLVTQIESELSVSAKDTGEYETTFVLADETLLFVMHTNIFTFDNNHEVWKTSYVQQDRSRAFCGKIFIYNFLSDSFRYNRVNDLGYLIARIFINKDGHYFVEGKKQLGYLYNDFSSSVLDESAIRQIIESAIIYSLDFDPFTPPYERVTEISVREVLDASIQSKLATGKRLGFKFQSDGPGPI
jgi:hypothetical protein